MFYYWCELSDRLCADIVDVLFTEEATLLGFSLLLFIYFLFFGQLYKKCGQFETAIGILEVYLKDHPPKDDLSVVEMLASVHMERNEHSKSLEHIESAKKVYSCGEEFPLNLTIREGICHAYLGDLEKAEVCYLNISGKRKFYLLRFRLLAVVLTCFDLD